MKVKDLVLLSFLAVILYVGQIGLAVLPNIEVVTILTMVYARVCGKKVYVILLIFTLLEATTFGPGPWLLSYGYIWPLLALLADMFRAQESSLFWALLGGFFGLFFGTLCSVPYFLTGGWGLGVAYIISGIPFDIIHCLGNFAISLILMKPLKRLLSRLMADF